ncbi:hypothetical protein SISNIDRAFT_449608 [Sistotremastrum niveocremeum HHB9708]|uniref:BTB domain-containing protein n=2 Tax=Sistotremastraceae TaxID=3402574 RepID=A0A164ZRR2_9AGAM|nr:hypothetical protein SISNIDRAFT_449608 [Sistotremastrum niveocremeum HHB9708]KZT32130.1 hypothetical protein SISSUDRAFT_1055959 [Sistotremastrum suecicum HHB10207 ss-3]
MPPAAPPPATSPFPEAAAKPGAPQSPAKYISNAFDNPDKDAEFVLVASDNVYFYVHKWPLAKASPVFKDMLSIGDRQAQPVGTALDPLHGLPFVEVTEAAHTLAALLEFVYPVTNPTIKTFELLSNLTDAAHKYDVAVVLKAVQLSLRESRFMDPQPLRVYAIAKRYGFSQVEKDAVRKCYAINPAKVPSLLIPREMEYLSARDLHRLLVYKRARAKGAIDLLAQARLSQVEKCLACKRRGCVWWPYFNSLASDQLREQPLSQALSRSLLNETKAAVMDSLDCHVPMRTSSRCSNFFTDLDQNAGLITYLQTSIDALPWEYSYP